MTLSSETELVKPNDWKKLNKALSLMIRDIEGLRFDLREAAAKANSPSGPAQFNVNVSSSVNAGGGTQNFYEGDTHTSVFNLSENIAELEQRLDVQQREIEYVRTVVTGGTGDGNQGGTPEAVSTIYNNTYVDKSVTVIDGGFPSGGPLQPINNLADLTDLAAAVNNLLRDNAARAQLISAASGVVLLVGPGSWTDTVNGDMKPNKVLRDTDGIYNSTTGAITIARSGMIFLYATVLADISLTPGASSQLILSVYGGQTASTDQAVAISFLYDAANTKISASIHNAIPVSAGDVLYVDASVNNGTFVLDSAEIQIQYI